MELVDLPPWVGKGKNGQTGNDSIARGASVVFALYSSPFQLSLKPLDGSLRELEQTGKDRKSGESRSLGGSMKVSVIWISLMGKTMDVFRGSDPRTCFLPCCTFCVNTD